MRTAPDEEGVDVALETQLVSQWSLALFCHPSMVETTGITVEKLPLASTVTQGSKAVSVTIRVSLENASWSVEGLLVTSYEADIDVLSSLGKSRIPASASMSLTKRLLSAPSI